MSTTTQHVISRDPEIRGGEPVFAGTRIPVGVLLDYLEAGQTVDDFLAFYPSLQRDAVIAALEELRELLASSA